MSKNQRMTARMFFALSPDLKQKVEARAKSLGMDGPGFARIALAVAAERGLTFGEGMTKADDEKGGSKK